MNITKEQLIAMAPVELKEMKHDFICPGDTYIILSYKIENGNVNWNTILTAEYGYCVEYQKNTEKDEYIMMRCLALVSFPPTPKVFNLKIQNILLGGYSSPGDTVYYQMKKIQGMFTVVDKEKDSECSSKTSSPD